MDHAVPESQSYQDDQDEIDKLEEDVEMEEEVAYEVIDDFEGLSNGDCDEWPWLKTFEINETREGVSVASIVAQRIDREKIRAYFYFNMGEPTQQMCEFAYDLFDRWGCVKADFLKHPIKRGTGVWGKELNEGEILLFESVTVDEKFRRQGIGKKLVQDVLAKVWPEVSKEGFRLAEVEDERSQFAIVWPEFFNDDHPGLDKLSPEALEAHIESCKVRAESFWRSLGFRRIGTSRWFALAANPAHPSHKLSVEADYNPPQKNATQNAFHNSIQAIISQNQSSPEGFLDTQKAIELDHCLVTLVQSHLHTHGAIHPSWTSVDKDGNTIAHLAIEWPELLKWLLSQPLYTTNSLFTIRNNQGEIPAEIFESPLKDRRVRRSFMGYTEHMSDEFRGYKEKDTDTLLLLRGLNPTTCTPEQRERVKWGCTCGKCISYLSPRVRFALSYVAYLFYQNLSAANSSDVKGWRMYSSECLKHLSPALVRKLHMKKHDILRDGLKLMFRFINIVIARRKQLPTVTNIDRLIQESSETAQLTVMEFLSQGGSISSVVLACFDEAISSSRYMGDGELELSAWKRVKKLPKCRNDNEFIMARNVYKEN